jgi:hypothetical protein
MHETETAADDETANALGRMKRYVGENQLNQKMVQELIEKIAFRSMRRLSGSSRMR